MLQSCPNCGFEGQRGARFCRQCGSPLFVEREVNLAATRQQPFQSGVSGEQSGWTTSGQWSGPSTDTSRFARVAAPGAYGIPSPKPNTHVFWGLTAAICALATFGLISASLLSFRGDQPRRPIREAIAAEIRDDYRREAERAARQAEDLARMSADKARIASEIARATGEAARARAATASSTANIPSLEDLIYPKAEVTNRISSGNQASVMKLETSDDFARVLAFYTAKLGEPQVANKTRAAFARSERGVDVVAKIGPSSENKGKTEISLVRSASKAP